MQPSPKFWTGISVRTSWTLKMMTAGRKQPAAQLHHSSLKHLKIDMALLYLLCLMQRGSSCDISLACSTTRARS
jgi:hypothetical protein